jgi:hypothetical protein
VETTTFERVSGVDSRRGIGLAKSLPMHAALARSEPDSRFVGQILMRSSPVLTWRPTVLERIERESSEGRIEVADVAGVQRIPLESSVRLTENARPSKTATRRVPAWPLVAKLVHHTRSDRAARFAVRTGSALLAGAVLGLLVLFAIGPLLVPTHAATNATAMMPTHAAPAPVLPTTTKAPYIHVSGDPIDTLAVVPSTDDEDDATADDSVATELAAAKRPTAKPHAKPKHGGPHAKVHPHPKPRRPTPTPAHPHR